MFRRAFGGNDGGDGNENIVPIFFAVFIMLAIALTLAGF